MKKIKKTGQAPIEDEMTSPSTAFDIGQSEMGDGEEAKTSNTSEGNSPLKPVIKKTLSRPSGSNI